MAKGSSQRKLILSLFDLTENWPAPYKSHGYEVLTFDIVRSPEQDVLKISPGDFSNVYGVLAAPPCTHFTNASSRLWNTYDADGRTQRSLDLVRHTLYLIEQWKPKFWALENPPGRLKRYIGSPLLYFHPYEYAGYLPHSDNIFESNRYRKKTCLWGKFNIPIKNILGPLDNKIKGQTAISMLPDSKGRDKKRSATPLGFAWAFWRVNQ